MKRLGVLVLLSPLLATAALAAVAGAGWALCVDVVPAVFLATRTAIQDSIPRRKK